MEPIPVVRNQPHRGHQRSPGHRWGRPAELQNAANTFGETNPGFRGERQPGDAVCSHRHGEAGRFLETAALIGVKGITPERRGPVSSTAEHEEAPAAGRLNISVGSSSRSDSTP